jgi:hypothetical protein
MAIKKYLQVSATGVPQEDNVNITLATELAAVGASAGSTLVGVNDGPFTNISGADLQSVLVSIDSAIGAAGNVDSVNGLTGVVVLTGQNVNTNHTAVNYTAASTAITSHLAGIDTKLGTISSPFNYKGAFNASAGNFAAISPASVGDWYKVTVAGTISSVTFDVGDNILINKNVGGTVVIADVDKIDNTDQVTSVNGQQGVVVLTSDDITSDATITVATPAGTSITDDLEALDSAIAVTQKLDLIKGFVAASTIAAGDPVYKSSATAVAPAQADQDTALEIIGIAAAAAVAAAPVNVIPFGPSGAIYSGLTSGNPVYLASGGGITETAVTTSGHYLLRIGKATSATAIDVETKNVAIKRA